MSKNSLLGLALASILTAGTAVAAEMKADDTMMMNKDKCYGIAMAGKNDCKSSDGSHTCKGMSKKDKDAHDWMLVDKGKCAEMGGKMEAPAAAPEKKS